MKKITKYIIIFFISMVPLIELRIAFPLAIFNTPVRLLPGVYINGFGLHPVVSYIICIIGNMVPVPFIYFFAVKVLNWGKDKKFIGKFFTFCLNKGHKGGKKLQEKAGRGLYFALFLFVGIPLPGTGAWTGTLAASLLDMDFKKSVAAVLSGVLLAGVLMGFSIYGVQWIVQWVTALF